MSPASSPPPSGSAPGLVTYNSSAACINHTAYTNDVLPANVGEFGTNGLDRKYWGGPKTRTVGSFSGTWGPGFDVSWGRHQYDTYFADPSDGLGIDPFSVGPDTAAPGSPNALRIAAMPLPTNLLNSLTVLANDQWQLTPASSSFSIPNEGGSLVVNVANANAGQNGWTVGMGYQGADVMFVGTLTSGGSTPSGNGSGGSNPWTISNIHVYNGKPGETITPGDNDEGGLRAYNFPRYVSGVLDTNVNQQYGFFVSRMRFPNYLPALSPAFWTLETGGVAAPSTGLQRNELDIAEMFGDTSANQINTNEILWNTNEKAGVGLTPFPNGNPQSDYHDYGVLQVPGSTTFYIDGQPVAGNTNLPDWTQGSPDKEIMLMFQVGSPGTWLDRNSTALTGNSWPQYVWSQWIRAYRPSSTSC
ncbi:MAG: hypothetical protein NVSMB5_09290 [Candidatus Velthaea sp.]